MPEPRLLSIGRAVPHARYTQETLFSHSPWPASPLLEHLFLASPVQTRALFVPPTFYDVPRTLTETNAAWRQGAMALGGRALQEALAGSGHRPDQIDMLGVTTVTGYATPGLDLLLAREHGLRRDLQRVHFNCIGCHAAVPLLRTVADHVAARPGHVAVALAVEVCSACFRASSDPQNLVAVSLFADGAAAVVMSTEGTGPVLVDVESAFDFDHIEALGFGLETTGFSIVLDPGIPDAVARGIVTAVDRLLSRNGLGRGDVARWCLHPGGSRVLDAAASALELTDEQIRPSRRVLRTYGNMSSPSVLFVLADVLQRDPPADGAYMIVAAFGPGLGVEAALLRC